MTLTKDIDLDKITKRFERRLRRFSELSILGLKERQVYPPSAFVSPDYILPDPCPIIDKTIPVGSMGSCFAREIKKYLEGNGFNYISRGEGKHAQHGSAPWDRVYNTACIRQEIKRAFGEFKAEYMTLPDGRVIDPFRKGTIYSSIGEADRACANYVDAARSALMDCKVFIITLGLSEVWFDKVTGNVFAETLLQELFDPEYHSYRLIGPEENYENVKDAIEFLKRKNPKIEFIVTVSPVPLRTTFFERSAIVSNNVSKASLLFCAHQLVQCLDYVQYFPSYEIAFHLFNDPFEWDYRHVKQETIDGIMELFEKVFCKADSITEQIR